MFYRNVCYGHSVPDESVLKHYGLSCKGESQTFDCTQHSFDEKSPDYDIGCGRFVGTQIMTFLAIVAMLVLSCGCCPSILLDVVMHTTVLIFVVSTMSVLRMSYMFRDEEHFNCVNILDTNIKVCHGYGASVYLQNFAIFTSAISLLLAVLLLVPAIREKCGSTAA